MRRSIIRPPELVFAYALLGGLPALYLSIWAALLVYFDIAALFSGDPEKAGPLPFYLPVGGLAATVSGILLLLGIGVSSTRGRLAHAVCLSWGVFVGLSWVWMLRGPGGGVSLFGLLPAVVGVALLFHLWHDAQQGAPP